MTQEYADVDSFLTGDVRTAIGRLADVIIPASTGKPLPTDVELHTRYIDVALGARPDLIEPLRQVLRTLADSTRDSAEALAEANEADLESVIQLVIVAYFMSAKARRSIEYSGQARAPIAEGEAEYYLEEDDILGPVLARGQRWREVPAT